MFGQGEAYLAAVGQAFVSLSLGMGALLTYDSYLSRSAQLPGQAARIVAYAMRRLRWSRRKAALLLGAAIFALSTLPSLGYGPLDGVRLFGGSILDGLDLAASQVVLPLGGLVFALFVGWAWGRKVALDEVGFERAWLGRTWLFMLRWVTPVLILVVLGRSVGVI